MADAITKKAFRQAVSKRVGKGVPQAHVDDVFKAIVDLIVELTAKGEKIHLNDLGKFEVKDRKARKTTAHWAEGKPEHIVGGGPRLTFSSFDNVNRRIAAIRAQPPKKRRQLSREELMEGLWDDLERHR